MLQAESLGMVRQKHGGTSFTIGNVGESLTITGLTLQSAANTTFSSNEVFTVAIFSGAGAGVTIEPPAGNDANVNPAYLNANSLLTLLSAEMFAADSINGSAGGTVTLDSREFINFNFANAVTVDGGEELTVFVFANFEFEYIESGSFNAAGTDGVQGGRFKFNSDIEVLSPSDGRNLNFAILGEAEAKLLGDVNQDGVVNFLDISPFITVLNIGFQFEADINQDTIVDFLDIAPFIELLSR